MKFCILSIVFLLINSSLFANLIITEIFPAPENDEPEWIELFNDSNLDFNNKISISDLTSTKSIDILNCKMNQFIVITKDTSELKLFRLIPKDAILIQLSLPSLNNTTDAVVLKYDNFTDSCFYDMKNGIKGKSFERINLKQAFINSNIGVSQDVSGATAGKFNSIGQKYYDLKLSYPIISNDSIKFKLENIGINRINEFVIDCWYRSENDFKFINFKELNYSKFQDSILEISFPLQELAIKINSFGKFILKFDIHSEKDQYLGNDTLLSNVYFEYPFGSISFNEIMYQISEDKSEFVELINNTDFDISLKNWKLFDKSGTIYKNYIIFDSNLIVKANDYVVVAFDSSIINFPEINLNNIHIPKKILTLNDTGDKLCLAQENNSIIDSIEYEASWHDAELLGTKNVSLEKINPKLESFRKSSWTSSASKLGGTPTLENSISYELKDESNLSATPNPFNPSGSQNEKFCLINYSIPFDRARIQAYIFDLSGIKVRTIESDLYSGSKGTIIWDGKNDDGFILPVGRYVLFIEALSIGSGEIQSNKTVLVIGN